MVRIKKEKILVKPEDIKPSSKKFELIGVLNPGAIRLKNGKIILYVRVMERLKEMQDEKYFYSPRCVGKKEFKIKLDKFKKEDVVSHSEWDFSFENGTKRLIFISHLRKVFLDKSGLKVLKIEKKPGFFGIAQDAELGVEDPRITKIYGKYYMTYVGLSRNEGVSTYLAVSDDGLKWKRKGIIFGEPDKDVVLFPEKIKGKYVAFDRPGGDFNFKAPRIWIAYSKDLLHWGELKGMDFFMKNEKFRKIIKSGAGPPPIKTNRGWLFIFHVVSVEEPKGFIYTLKRTFGMHVKPGSEIYGVWGALLDHDNPEKVISRSYSPIFYSRENQKSLEGKRVIFPTGLVSKNNCKNLLVYSGSGDRVVSVKEIRLKDIMKTLRK